MLKLQYLINFILHRSWTEVSPMAIRRIMPGVTTLNGKIFVVGGEQESKILANGECYNPISDMWNKIDSMVIPRCEFGLVTLYGYLYAVGGYVGQNIDGSIERLVDILYLSNYNDYVAF